MLLNLLYDFGQFDRNFKRLFLTILSSIVYALWGTGFAKLFIQTFQKSCPRQGFRLGNITKNIPNGKKVWENILSINNKKTPLISKSINFCILMYNPYEQGPLSLYYTHKMKPRFYHQSMMAWAFPGLMGDISSLQNCPQRLLRVLQSRVPHLLRSPPFRTPQDFLFLLHI